MRPWTAKRLKYSSAEKPGPEVVDDEPDAHVAELAERAVARGGLVEHQRLGDLEDERRRLEARRQQDGPDLGGETRLDGLTRRDVDAHRQRRVGETGLAEGSQLRGRPPR